MSDQIENQVNETDEVEAAPKAKKAPRESENGVTKPAEGTKTGKVWEIADDISRHQSRPALREEVMTAGLDLGLNRGTIATQYSRWTQFYGVSAADRKVVRGQVRDATKEAAADVSE